MEIKIVEQNGTEYAGLRTTILEGTEISHESVYFANKDKFQEIYSKKTQGITGHVIGIPNDYWKQEGPDIGNEYFHLLFYNNLRGEIEFIVVKNAIIYITTNGQTIDKINC